MTDVHLHVHHSSSVAREETAMDTENTVETEDHEDDAHIVRGLD